MRIRSIIGGENDYETGQNLQVQNKQRREQEKLFQK